MPTPFQARVYELCRCIPQGRVTTYAAIARALGIRSPRAVGQALRHNPYAPEVPCHRVVASNGTLGGFNGHRGGPDLERKRALLRSEGVSVPDHAPIPSYFQWDFPLANSGQAANRHPPTGD